MEIQFLGTGAGLPSKNRNVTAIALKLLDEINQVWLFDCGEATQHQILRTTIKPRKIQKIFITHLHGDHIFGLPGFLSSRSFQGGAEPLTIYGPKGIREFIMTSLKISQSKLTYPLEFVEFDQPGQIVNDEKFNVFVTQLDHGVLSYGFRIEEKDHPGELQADRLHALGVPYGPLFGQLKAGQTITLEDGRTINGKDYISAARKGRIVTIFGDTRYQEAFASFAKNSDVIVYESTFEQAEQSLARRYFHSTTADAAKLAKEADAKQLFLTHISARYLGSQAEQLEKEAQAIFAQTTVVKDFDTISIPLS